MYQPLQRAFINRCFINLPQYTYKVGNSLSHLTNEEEVIYRQLKRLMLLT